MVYNTWVMRYFTGCLILLMGYLSASCSQNTTPEFTQGFQMIRQMVSPRQLPRSMFSAAFPACEPSEFVTFYFSGLGAAERPPTEESAPMEGLTPADIRAAGMTPYPSGISFVPEKPDATKGKQIVLKADDTRDVLILEAYDNPMARPVATEEVPIPKIKPSPEAVMFYESNQEMGLGY